MCTSPLPSASFLTEPARTGRQAQRCHLALVWLRGRKSPCGKGFATSPSSQARENWARNRGSSQAKQLCVPNCATTPLSLLQCLVCAEKRPRAEEKVPPVDYYYFFVVVAAPWIGEKKQTNKQKASSHVMLCESLKVWCCGAVQDGATSVRVKRATGIFFSASPVTIINSNILPKRSSSPETLRGKIHHQSYNPPCTTWFVVHGRANLKPPVEMIIDGPLLGSEAI